MTEMFIQRVSSYAGDIDFLIDLVTVLAGFWFLVAEVALFYLLFRFRRKPDTPSIYIDGTDKKHKRWINTPHIFILIFDVVLIVAATKVWYNIKQDAPPADATIGVISQQWAWSFQHPGADNVLDTDDDIFNIDDNGDGLGTPASWFRGVYTFKRPRGAESADGLRANQFHLVKSVQEQALSAEVRKRRDALESELSVIREKRDALSEQEYLVELERICLEIARLYRDSEK